VFTKCFVAITTAIPETETQPSTGNHSILH